MRKNLPYNRMHFRYVVYEMQNVFLRSLLSHESKTLRADWGIACPLNYIHKIRSRKILVCLSMELRQFLKREIV